VSDTIEKLFSDFENVSSKEWKQKIQFELKGADYNDTLVWESLEGIKVKPFYHADDFKNNINITTESSNFKILQDIFVFDIEKSNKKAQDVLKRGAESIRFTIEKESIDFEVLMKNLPLKTTNYFICLKFISLEYIQQINAFAKNTNAFIYLQVDPIQQLITDGNWFTNLESDFKIIDPINFLNLKSSIAIQSSVYQNAGANMVQQIAYTLAHVNEYFNRVSTIPNPIIIEVAIGTNYFFEIAKLRAIRMLFQTLATEYNHHLDCHIVAVPTKRNKTLYDYNVNMLRTTTECMSAILGGANTISNLPYDALYHKTNEFGDRISRNQLLVLKQESYFDKVNNPADGSFYIETLTEQLSEKALELFKKIESKGGLITLLIEGTIQRKITESAQKEQDLFDTGKEVLLGTNKYPNKNDKMKHDLELFPFVKTNPRKTLITPIIEKRLAEKIEQERLSQEE
jgi:methylmalonyl-CoA mutase